MSFTFAFLTIFASHLTFALPVNPNLSIAQKWTFNATQPSSSSSSSNSTSQSITCLEDEIYLTPKGIDPGCYQKKYEIFQSCIRNEQCQINESYCGYHEVNDYEEHLCVCNPGYAESWDNSTCDPYRKCSLTDDFNDSYLQADCEENQFCRKGSCHCMPNYSHNSAGMCVWNVPDVKEWKRTSKLKRWLKQNWIWISITGILTVFFTFIVGSIVYWFCCCKRGSDGSNNQQQETINLNHHLKSQRQESNKSDRLAIARQKEQEQLLNSNTSKSL